MNEERKEPIDDNSDEILLPSELAARLRLTRSWIYDHADELGVDRLGKYLRFRWSRVLERLNKK